MITIDYQTLRENKILTKWLLEYDTIQATYKSKLAAQTEIAATNLTGMPHASGVGNPTANKALAATGISELAEIIAVVQAVHRILSPKQMIFLQARRDTYIVMHDTVGRPGWIKDTQQSYMRAIQYQYGYYSSPSEQTMQKWWRQILHSTVRVAGRMGKKII